MNKLAMIISQLHDRWTTPACPLTLHQVKLGSWLGAQDYTTQCLGSWPWPVYQIRANALFGSNEILCLYSAMNPIGIECEWVCWTIGTWGILGTMISIVQHHWNWRRTNHTWCNSKENNNNCKNKSNNRNCFYYFYYNFFYYYDYYSYYY